MQSTAYIVAQIHELLIFIVMSYYIVAGTLIPSYFFSKGATQSYQGNWIGFDLIA